MKPRPDLLDARSPAGLEIYQLTDNPELPACHVYMEAPIFTPDSRRFILHESAHPHGSDPADPRHRYLVCDLDDNAALHPITDELGPTAPAVIPDGQYLYYFIDETRNAPGRLTLKRVRLDGAERTTLQVVEGVLPGAAGPVTYVYPLSTISSDGRRLAQSVGLGADTTGVLVFDTANGAVNLVFQGPQEQWANSHLQYCRSPHAEQRRDLLIQHSHGRVTDNPGFHKLQEVDIHVLRDDGTNLRTMPWGRGPAEYAQGHQCWRGPSFWAVTSTITFDPRPDNPAHTQCRLIEARPTDRNDHPGHHCAGARNDLSRDFDNPQFYHFAIDPTGGTLITDCWLPDGNPFSPDTRYVLYLARLGRPGIDPATDFTYLLDSGITLARGVHAHPFLSPDARTGFFNSNESGTLQAYMIRNLPQL